jgi:hypothetical protein
MLEETQETKAQSTGKIRVQFDFAPDALQRLDELKQESGARTRAETVRNALSLYEWFLGEISPDDTIQVLDRAGKLVSSFKARLLRR